MVTKQGDFHQPTKLYDKNGFAKNYEKALLVVRDGLTVENTCIAVFGITGRTFRNWKKWAFEDIEAGFTSEDSNLIKLILGLSKEDLELNRKVSKKAFDVAINDGDVKMIKFLLKTRYGYNEKTKHEIEATNNAPFTFNIVPMTPNEAENENNH